MGKTAFGEDFGPFGSCRCWRRPAGLGDL